MRTLRFLSFAIVILALLQIPCSGQKNETLKSESIEIGKKYNFYSEVLDEEMEIWVRLPNNYSTIDGQFPAIYLLDGPAHFIYMSGLLDKLEQRGVPKSIVVGIRSNDRNRDFTPEITDKFEAETFPSSGGADDFKDMLEADLFPFMRESFRVNGFRTLIGHSLGGLFAFYALATEPQLFNAYLAISPSIWWNNQAVVDSLEIKLINNPDLHALLYMSIGNESEMDGDPIYKAVIYKAASVLESFSSDNIRWTSKIHPKETHTTNYFISAIEGLEFFYKDWYIPNPGQEYLSYGLGSFKMRSRRIKEEFNEEWEMSTEDYWDIIFNLNESKRYEETLDLVLPILEDNYCSLFLFGLAEAYSGLDEKKNAIKYYSEAYKLAPGDTYLIDVLDSLGVDRSKLSSYVKLTDKELERYAGTYQNDYDTKAILSCSNDTIISTVNGREYYIIPMTKSKAYISDSAWTIDFIFDNENTIIGYVVNYEFGDPEMWQRVDNLD